MICLAGAVSDNIRVSLFDIIELLGEWDKDLGLIALKHVKM